MGINYIPALIQDRAIVGTSGKTLYQVAGRIVGDDEDTVYLVRADSYAEAWAAFEQERAEDADLQPEDIKDLETIHGAWVIHSSIFMVGEITE